MNPVLWKERLRKTMAGVVRFATWWVNELKTFLPKQSHEIAKRRIEAHPKENQIELRIIRGEDSALGEIAADGSISSPEFSQLLDWERARLPVWLVAPADTVLCKTVQIPRSAAPHFTKLLPIEIPHWTPFSLDQLVLGWRRLRDRIENKADIELRFVPRDLLSPWSEILSKRSLQPVLVVLGDMHVPYGVMSTAKRRERQLRIAAVLALIISSATFAVSDWVAAVRERDRWVQNIQHERRALTRQQAVQTQIDDIVSAAREAREAEGRARGLLLARIAAVLPESDWLTDVSLRGETIMLRGYSLRPELLLKTLESLAAERAITLQGETTFDARLSRNRFSLGFQAAKVPR